jgi:uncharacterized RDD family membrane protein YckC
MTTKKTPLKIDGISTSIYAGFWIRLGSLLLDFIIMIPVVAFILYLNGLSLNSYYYTFIPNLIFTIWYRIYLVKKYGGTPGKLIMGIKILKIDGSDVSWKEAILREIVIISLTIFADIIQIIALSQADKTHYESLTWLTKEQYVMSLTPLLFTIYTWLSNTWVYSEFFVLLFNKRKRALHDFIAKTVIVRTMYIDKIRETMNADNNIEKC